MNKYQIVEITENFNHAGTKATQDIAVVADKLGFKSVKVRMISTRKTKLAKLQRQYGYFVDWSKAYKTIEDGSVVLLQHPFHYPQLTREKVLRKLKTKKHVKYISIVHDVEELRAFRFNDYYKHEFEVMLSLADAIVVHNSVMLEYFVQQGVDRSKLVNLEIFDYLQDGAKDYLPVFERVISIAGNLDVTKCGYISELGKLDKIKVTLYGPNFDEKMKAYKHIDYRGSFPTDEIPTKLTSGFGLVWDGTSIDGCKGKSGQYLRYNNPHKLSLYLASGIPVVIWSNAAEADFVKSNNLGICVSSLIELNTVLNNMNEEEYNTMACSVATVRKKLVSGYYAKEAILQAEKIVGE